MRGVLLTRKLDKTGLIVSWLLHRDGHMRQYYGEHYNRDVQVHNVKPKLFLFSCNVQNMISIKFINAIYCKLF